MLAVVDDVHVLKVLQAVVGVEHDPGDVVAGIVAVGDLAGRGQGQSGIVRGGVVDSFHQLVAVADEGDLHLAEAPQILHAGVVRRYIGEGAGVIGVLQILTVDFLVVGGHLVGVHDKAGENGKVRCLGADLLGKDAVLLAAVLVLFDDLPPAVNGLTIGEGFGVVVPEGLGGVERIAVAEQALVDMGADVLRIEGGDDAVLIVAEEHIAVDVLHLQHIALDVAGIGFQAALLQDLIVVQIHDVHGQAGESFLKGVLHLEHFGGGGVDVDGAAVLDLFQGLGIELFVAHLAPVVIDGAVKGRILYRGRVGLRRGVGLLLRGRGILLGGPSLGAAAGDKTQEHAESQQQSADLAQFHSFFSFRPILVSVGGFAVYVFRGLAALDTLSERV